MYTSKDAILLYESEELVMKHISCELFVKNSGFTLAEVLITLGIIGVVSAMTLPSLVSNVQSTAMVRKKELFESRLEEAMNQMRFHEKLTGYSTADKFVDEFEKYIKINERCDSSNLSNCFNVEISSNLDEYYVDTDLKTGSQIATGPREADFPSDNVSIIFADGVSAIINYDSTCEWLDPIEFGLNRSEAKTCISMVYDMNGFKGSGIFGKDLYSLNSKIGYLDLDGVLWDMGDTPFSAENTCSGSNTYDSAFSQTAIESAGYSSYADCNLNYWAGAKRACVENGKRLPTLTEASALMDYLFNEESVSGDGHTLDMDKFESTGLATSFGTYGAGYYRLWTSNESSNKIGAYYKLFSSTYVAHFAGGDLTNQPTINKSFSQPLVRCVTD
ncbi:MAG: type II secretion system protein [Candidatus Gastranaerophilales bacterium]